MLDLLLLGDVELATDRLTLPHPEVPYRRFVLAPLLELHLSSACPTGRNRRGARGTRAGSGGRGGGPSAELQPA